MGKDKKKKDVEATKSWDDVKGFASNLMQFKSKDLEDAKSSKEQENRSY